MSTFRIHGLEWKFYGNANAEHIGYIPEFLHALDTRPAKEQFNENYAHGGGWHKFDEMKFEDGARPMLVYPVPDEPSERFPAWAETKLRDERIIVTLSAWVCIVQPDGSYEVSRMD